MPSSSSCCGRRFLASARRAMASSPCPQRGTPASSPQGLPKIYHKNNKNRYHRNRPRESRSCRYLARNKPPSVGVPPRADRDDRARPTPVGSSIRHVGSLRESWNKEILWGSWGLKGPEWVYPKIQLDWEEIPSSVLSCALSSLSFHCDRCWLLIHLESPALQANAQPIKALWRYLGLRMLACSCTLRVYTLILVVWEI